MILVNGNILHRVNSAVYWKQFAVSDESRNDAVLFGAAQFQKVWDYVSLVFGLFKLECASRKPIDKSRGSSCHAFACHG